MRLDVRELRNTGKLFYSDLLKNVKLDFKLYERSEIKSQMTKNFIARVSFSTLEIVDLFSSYDDNPDHVLQWKNILRSSYNPAKMFDIIVQEDEGVPALMILCEDIVQFICSDIVSAIVIDIEQVSLTDDDSIYLKSKCQHVAFTCSRTIELYKLLLNRITIKPVENVPKGHLPIYTLSESYQSNLKYNNTLPESYIYDIIAETFDSTNTSRPDSGYSERLCCNHGYINIEMLSESQLYQNNTSGISNNTRQAQNPEISSDKSSKDIQELLYKNTLDLRKEILQGKDCMIELVSKDLPLTSKEEDHYVAFGRARYDPNNAQEVPSQTSSLSIDDNKDHTEGDERQREEKQHINRPQSENILLNSTKHGLVIRSKSADELLGNTKERISPGTWRENSKRYREWVPGKATSSSIECKPEDVTSSTIIYDTFEIDNISKIGLKREGLNSTEETSDLPDQTYSFYIDDNKEHTKADESQGEEKQHHRNQPQSGNIIINSTKHEHLIHSKSSDEFHGNTEERKPPGAWRENSKRYREWVPGKATSLYVECKPEDASSSSIIYDTLEIDKISKIDINQEGSNSIKATSDLPDQTSSLSTDDNKEQTKGDENQGEENEGEENQHKNQPQSGNIIINWPKHEHVIYSKSSDDLLGTIEEKKSPGAWRIISKRYKKKKQLVAEEAANLYIERKPEDVSSNVYDSLPEIDKIPEIPKKQFLRSKAQEGSSVIKKKASMFTRRKMNETSNVLKETKLNNSGKGSTFFI